ncbi:MFS transporter [Eilatimonas milleporae]|uniref:Sugar phosphate permease n=1 Tax=Eilatimonas milleporae TaxID=911205 RepID=A0A3M0C4C1_9PROT|nr:MFS transporter [Eilatimonas milleporae]RMB01929.1 sugar phosphate permease [Eilatimonas milleporae]
MPENPSTIARQATAASEFSGRRRLVASAAVGVGLGLTGMVFYTLGLFFLPLSAEFGWTRAELSIIPMVLTGTLIVMSPIVGSLSDKFGVRRVGLTGLVGLTLGLLLLSQAGPSLRNYYLIWLIVSIMGAGTIPVVWTRAINAAFQRRRGLALGLTLCGTGLSAAMVPPLLGGVIEIHGWRGGFLAMASLILFVGLPIVFLFFHQGTSPGKITARNGSEHDAPMPDGMTFAQALNTRHFWMIAIGFLCLSLTISGVIVHMPALLADSGLSGERAGAMVGIVGVTILVGRLLVGFLVDRYNPPVIAFIFLSLPILSCLLLASGTSDILVLQGAVLLLGLSAGAEVDLLAFLTNRSFGLRAYGSIYGFLLSFFSVGAGLGPLILGLGYDANGSYQDGLIVMTVCTLVGSLCVLTLRQASA